jgi:hypothetical protein
MYIRLLHATVSPARFESTVSKCFTAVGALYNEITNVKGYGQVWTGLRLRTDVACLGDYSNLSFLLDPPKFSTGDFSEPLSAGGGD